MDVDRIFIIIISLASSKYVASSVVEIHMNQEPLHLGNK